MDADKLLANPSALERTAYVLIPVLERCTLKVMDDTTNSQKICGVIVTS